ncbi:hypothetical protein CC2G_009832 [Coprinopsis cinerea AmutBmut pab1-1]|nr:hypothetical protein CC2G_009832 [Coprinopsis cinerea AmutBmut pab1-1]
MDPVQTLIQALEHARLSNSIAIGVVAIWLYDWLSALPLEVELIWKSRWGLVKSIFIFGRVLFPLHSISTLIYVHSSVLTKAECHSVFAVGSISGVAHSFLAEAVIYLQVYALSQGNRWMGIFLGIQFVAFAIAVAILQALFFKSMAYMVLPFEGFHCIPFKFHNGVATATYNAAIATESVIVLITFWIVYRKYGHSRSRMLQVLLRDGLLYMHGIVCKFKSICARSCQPRDFLRRQCYRPLIQLLLIERRYVRAQLNFGRAHLIDDHDKRRIL